MRHTRRSAWQSVPICASVVSESGDSLAFLPPEGSEKFLQLRSGCGRFYDTPAASPSERLSSEVLRRKCSPAGRDARLAQVLDVPPHALSLPDIDSYVGLMHTLFTLEDNYGLKVTEQDGELALQVDFRKNKDAARLHEMLWAWRGQAAKLEAGEISQEDYNRWRYHYPEYDSSQIHAKVPPEGLI